MGKAENYVEKYLKTQAEKKGFLVFKFTSPGNNGVPDRLLIGHNRVVFIETKAPGETPRPLQLAVIDNMKAHGAEVYVFDTREQVDDFLKDFHSIF